MKQCTCSIIGWINKEQNTAQKGNEPDSGSLHRKDSQKHDTAFHKQLAGEDTYYGSIYISNRSRKLTICHLEGQILKLEEKPRLLTQNLV